MATLTPILAWAPGGGELMIILAIVVLLFGGSKLPALARGLGEAKKEFKKASREDDETVKPVEAKKPDVPGSSQGPN